MRLTRTEGTAAYANVYFRDAFSHLTAAEMLARLGSQQRYRDAHRELRVMRLPPPDFAAGPLVPPAAAAAADRVDWGDELCEDRGMQRQRHARKLRDALREPSFFQ